MRMRIRIVGLLATVGALLVPLTAPVGAVAQLELSETEAMRGAHDSVPSADRVTGSALERPPWTDTSCPEMTDSVTRLYSAFFQRQPDQDGFEFWTTAYSAGEWNLDKMARQFVVSDEFVETYGELTNAQFIDQLYLNVQGRAGDPAGRAFWLGQLDAELMTRGRVMINFSESEEYVTSTGTVRPMAGYLGWYPEGTTWSCSSGTDAAALPETPGFSDILVSNFERTEQRYTIGTYNRAFEEPIIHINITLPNDFYDYYRAREFGPGDGYIEFDMSDEMYWIVVNYPTAMVDLRDGWS